MGWFAATVWAAKSRPCPGRAGKLPVMNNGRGLRDFWLLWSASTVSNLGDGIRFVALPLLAISITTDPLMLGAITASIYLPWFLFSLPGGAIADRHDRRKLILVGQSARAVSVAGFALLISNGQPRTNGLSG